MDGCQKIIAGEASLITLGLIGDIADQVGHLRTKIYPDESMELARTGQIAEILHLMRERIRALSRKDIIHALKTVDNNGWGDIVVSLETRMNQSESLVSQFGHLMKSEELESVLQFRKSAKAMWNSVSLVKQFLGVSIAQMPKVKDGKPEDFAAIEIIRAAIELQDLMEKALVLTEVFEFIPAAFEIDFETEIAKSWKYYFDS